MKPTTQLLGATSAFALVVMTSTPAMAEGIRAGETITNTVDVTYAVGGVTQNVEEASDTFAIDRRVNVTVAAVNSPVTVNPGEEDAFLTFTVTNLSNDTVDLDLDTVLAGSSTGTDISAADFNNAGASGAEPFQIWVEDDGVAGLSTGDLLLTGDVFLDEVAADETRTVYVVADIGLSASNAEEFDVVLTADAHAARTVGTLGAELTESAGDSADPLAVDTVLADADGFADNANEGDFSAEATYVVAGALVDVIKTSIVVSDPVNGASNPKAIPGAVIRYCIAVRNAAGGAEATNISIVDDLPVDVTFNSGTILRNATVSIATVGGVEEATCTGGTGPANAAEGSLSTGTGPSGEDQVIGTLSNITGGNTSGFSFEVTIPAAAAGTPAATPGNVL